MSRYFCKPGISDLTDDEAEQEEVVVVSSFGTTSMDSKGYKSSPMEMMLGKNLLNRDVQSGSSADTKIMNGIEGYFDHQHKVIYLHLKGCSDASTIHQSLIDMSESLAEKGFLSVWADLKFQYARSLLLLFSVSHLLLLNHPSHVFDTTYIHLFQSLDSVRNKIAPILEKILKEIPGIGSVWSSNGRLCSPRVLFLFSSKLIPSHLRVKKNDHGTDNFKKNPIQNLEFDLEYKIYSLLRKSRVITNTSANSLFALPNNQPFVHVLDPTHDYLMTESLAKTSIRQCCDKNRDDTSTSTKKKPNIDSSNAFTTLSDCESADFLSQRITSSISSDPKRNTTHSFEVFLQQHIVEATNKHFDDNVGRNAGQNFFEVPKANVWFKAYAKLHDYMIQDVDPKNELVKCLRSHLNIDARFSDVRCSKILPLAIAAYKEGLPPYYSQSEHQTKLEAAMNIMASQSRGPAYEKYLQKLETACKEYWEDGRIGCETLSLTGNMCHFSQHTVQEDKNSCSGQAHSSEVTFVSYCSCGYTRAKLVDPFTVKEVNFDFYDTLETLCCRRLTKYAFATFRSSVDDAKANMSANSCVQDRGTPEVPELTLPLKTVTNFLDSPVLTTEMSPSAGGLGQRTTQMPTLSDFATNKSEIIVNVVEEKELALKDKDLAETRLASTTEYLAGMLRHSSPPGLLPLYCSWSLFCLGASSLYSHNSGISDQPGFVQGTNFLLPWDVTVKIRDKDKWPVIADSMGKKGFLLKNKKNRLGGDLTEFNVKIFLGTEYQCLRGHRFMMASPDKHLKATTAGHVKDTASKIANSDMPLYFPCPCSRIGSVKYGQLTRLHIVTPKAPVNVTLKPLVQPGSNANSKFLPQHNCVDTIKLSASAYWVLRLPFAYQDDKGPYHHPDSNQTLAPSGKLLKGCYGISEITLEM